MRTGPSPQIASLRARAAAYSRWGNEPDPSGATAVMRDKFMQGFYDRTPEDQPHEVRLAMAERLKKAHFARLGLKSAIARRAKRDAKRLANDETQAKKPTVRKTRARRAEPEVPVTPVEDDGELGSFAPDEAA